MKRYQTPLLLIFCAIGLALSTAYSIFYIDHPSPDKGVEARIEQCQQSALTIAKSWIKAVDEHEFIDACWQNGIPQQWIDNDVTLFLYKGDSLLFWANDIYITQIDSMNYDPAAGIVSKEDISSILREFNSGDRRAVITVNLTKRGALNSAIFSEPSSQLLPLGGQGQAVELPYCAFNISIPTTTQVPWIVTSIGWLALFAGIFALKKMLRRGATKENAIQKLIIFVVAIVAIRVVEYFIDIPQGGSYSLSSLGSLLITQLFILVIVQQAYQLRYKIRWQIDTMTKVKRYFILYFFTLFINCAVAYFHYAMVQTIYSNSTNIELYNILSIEPHTILFYFICAVFVALRVIYGRFFAIALHQFPFAVRLVISVCIMTAIIVPIEQYIGGTGYILMILHVLFLVTSHFSRLQNDQRVFLYDLLIFTAYITLFSAIESSSAKSIMAERYSAEMSTRSLSAIQKSNLEMVFESDNVARKMTYTIFTDNQVVLKAGYKLDAQMLLPFMNTEKDTIVTIKGFVHNIKKCRGGYGGVAVVSYQKNTVLDVLALYGYLFIWLFIVSGIIVQISPMEIYRHYNPRSMLYRIRLMIFGVVVISTIVVCWIVYKYSGSSYRDQQHMVLNTSVQSLLNSYNTYARQVGADSVLANWYSSRGSTSGYIVNIYDLNAKRIGGSAEHISASNLYHDAYRKLYIMNLPYFEQSYKTGDMQLSVAYVPMYWEKQKAGYMSVVLTDTDNIESRYALLGNIFNVFVVLFLVAIGLSMGLYNIISKPLSILSDALGSIGQMQKVPVKESSRSHDEVGALIVQYNTMIDYLQESYAALARAEREGAWREMARQVAHEIKNPLTPMRLKIQMLQRARNKKSNDMEQQLDSTLEMLLQQIDILNKIATEFSDLARMPQGAAVRIELTELLRNTVGLYSANECVDVIFESQSSSGVFVLVEYAGLTRVIVNLLQNAMQALQGYGVVNVRLSVKDNLAIIDVIDNGIGIPDDVLCKIFEPNFTTKSSGSGLGLAISRQIIESAGGTIVGANRAQGGAIFTITLSTC